MTFAELRVDIVILACAISCGIHAALAPAHFEEGTAAGIGFVVAAVALALSALALTRNPSRLVLLATAGLLAGLIVVYVPVIATGLPVLHPDQEPVEALALCTKAIEAIGLVVAAACIRRPAAPWFAAQERTVT